LCVGEERISAVDDYVAFLEQKRELIDDRVNRRSGLDHDLRFARLLKRADKFLNRARRLNIFSFGAAAGEFLGHFGGPIKNGNGKSLRFHVEDKILAHHSQANQANITLIRGHFGSPLLARRKRPRAVL